MAYIYLVLSVFMSASSTLFGNLFNKQCQEKKNTSTLYNFLLLTSVFLCWSMLYVFDLSFDVAVLGYSILFAVFYTTCKFAIINALKHGPMMLTSLFVGLSLILTTIWGFFFWDVSITVSVITGVVLVSIAIYLCLYTDKKDGKEFSWKWLVYALLALVSNAGCSIVQRTQQIQFNGKYGNMLMFFATLFSVLVYTVFYLKNRKENMLREVKHLWWIPVVSGMCNVVLNVFVMLMALTDLSPSLIYPIIGVGSLGVTTIASLVIFKEKMCWWQWVGIGIGAIAIALLS